MSYKKTVFQDAWLSNPMFSTWLKAVPNKYFGGCRLCNSEFSLSNMGKRAVTSHMKGQKHSGKAKYIKSSLPLSIFSERVNAPSVSAKSIAECVSADNMLEDDTVSKVPVVAEISAAVTVPVVDSSSLKKNVLKRFLVGENVTKAEVIWCQHMVVEHMSFRSAARSISIMKLMCTDSEIVGNMQMEKTKVAYTIVYGIAPYFSLILREQLKEAEHIVVGFDES